MHSRLHTAVFTLMAASPLLGQTLLKDFQTAPHPEVASSGAMPIAVTQTGELLFTAYSPGSGRELWSTDGTPTGTQLLADVRPGYQSSQAIQFVTLPSGLIMFTARTEQHGWELWRTDGTTAGTSLVKDILPGPVGSVAVELPVVGNGVHDDDCRHQSLWKHVEWHRTDCGTRTGRVCVYRGARSTVAVVDERWHGRWHEQDRRPSSKRNLLACSPHDVWFTSVVQGASRGR